MNCIDIIFDAQNAVGGFCLYILQMKNTKPRMGIFTRPEEHEELCLTWSVKIAYIMNVWTILLMENGITER